MVLTPTVLPNSSGVPPDLSFPYLFQARGLPRYGFCALEMPQALLIPVCLFAGSFFRPFCSSLEYPKELKFKVNNIFGPEDIAISLDKVPTRESYTFTGWYADKELTTKISSIKMTSNKTVYAGWKATGVPDMLNGDDHYAYVVGYTNGTVRPNANISRAEVATIFFRLLKEGVRSENLTTSNTFKDVLDGQWHNTPISTMAKLGVVKGRNAECFDPDAPITRAEFATICASFDTTQINSSSNFSDISGHWAEKISKEPKRLVGLQAIQMVHSVRTITSPARRP